MGQKRLSEAMLGSLGHRIHCGDRRLPALGACGGVPASADVGGRDPDREFARGCRVRRPVGDAVRDGVRRQRDRHAAARLDQSRPSHRVLPGGRPRDQARVHRRPVEHATCGSTARRRGARRHDRAGSDLPAGHSRRAADARMGRADRDGHRLRRRASDHAGRPDPDRAARLPDRGGRRRRPGRRSSSSRCSTRASSTSNSLSPSVFVTAAIAAAQSHRRLSPAALRDPRPCAVVLPA